MDAHLFITVLAYHVLHAIRTRLRNVGIHDSWATVRERLSTQVRISTLLKMQNDHTVHLRQTSRPDAYPKSIFDALSISPQPGRTVKAIA